MLTCVDAMLHNLPAKFYAQGHLLVFISTKIADSADVIDRAGILCPCYHKEGRGGYITFGT